MISTERNHSLKINFCKTVLVADWKRITIPVRPYPLAAIQPRRAMTFIKYLSSSCYYSIMRKLLGIFLIVLILIGRVCGKLPQKGVSEKMAEIMYERDTFFTT
jgi:hypothetical protein